ncbi:MAG: SprT family zinc-dependent metalloprotease [Candidatus ainarchaeum sp.]|nr:SprT family zinc-dependent metalloprotease [Candidatus ainarchaeum sp.]
MDSVVINNRTYAINRILSRNRNASARLKDGAIVVSVPARWPTKEREEIGDDLLRRAIKSIEKGRWSPESSRKSEFSHGQKVKALGKQFEIVFVDGTKFGVRNDGGRIVVKVNDSHPDKQQKISSLVRKNITKAVMPELVARVSKINQAHFQSEIRDVKVRDAITRWGSCSRDGRINLNFRLLFVPEDILDYVIVHELAHTKYRSHGKRFWELVGRVMPDHKEKRRWLRRNGWSALSEKQDSADFMPEEPY